MKAIMISGDVGVTHPNSPAGKRTEEYRKILGELDVLLCYGGVFSFATGLWRGLAMMRKKKFDVITAQSPEHWALAWILFRCFSVPWQMQIHTDILNSHFIKHSVFNKIRVWIAKFLL